MTTATIIVLLLINIALDILIFATLGEMLSRLREGIGRRLEREKVRGAVTEAITALRDRRVPHYDA